LAETTDHALSNAPWWRLLRGDPAEFLLGDDPGVVWRTLVVLLSRPGDSPAVVRARAQSQQSGLAAAILQGQSAEGYWGSPVAYGARWSGTAWHVSALAQLGADPEDPRVVRGAEMLLEVLQPRYGGFATTRQRPPSPCFTAELCAALVRLGFGRHARVREAVAWLAAHRGEGWSCAEERHLVDGCCLVTAVAVLRVVGHHPPEERSALMTLADRAAGWLEQRGFFCTGPAPHGWWELAHPCLYRVDALDALAALAKLGRRPSAGVLAALLGLLARQDTRGRWEQQVQVPFGEPSGKPSRWVTLKAVTTLATFGPALAQAQGEAAAPSEPGDQRGGEAACALE
jgi:hypothetical protein